MTTVYFRPVYCELQAIANKRHCQNISKNQSIQNLKSIFNINKQMQSLLKKYSRNSCSLLACMFLASACSGPLVIGSIYNSASNRITKEMKSYAKFSKAQKIIIDERFSQYHQWHRVTQLPLYGGLLRDIATQLESNTDIPDTTVQQWLIQINNLSMTLRHCNPLNDSNDFWSTLSDQQISQIKQKTADTHTLRVEKYQSETPSERSARRHKEILTWAKRAGLKFNSMQSDLLAKTLAQQTSLGGQRLFIWQQWTDQFNSLLTTRHTDHFADNMNKHMKSLWTLTQKNYPEEWQSSRELWTDFIHQFLSLQTKKQNQALYKKTTSIATTLDTISKDGPASVIPQCFDASGQ